MTKPTKAPAGTGKGADDDPQPEEIPPLVKTHGGKWYLARRIINCFPSHRTYVEPFTGGLSVLLNKPRVADEVASDLNDSLGLMGGGRW